MDRTLKQGPNRTVELESGREPRVVKRFHSRGLLGRILDRRRAAREYGSLRALAERGLPVPEVLALERAGGRWQVAMRWIEQARPLAELLTGTLAWPCPAGELARTLGHLLGQGHAAGVRQVDLHAGNVLVDRQGRAWLVDTAGVRFGTVTPDAAREDLVRACALLREHTSPGFRARALVAWRRASPPALRRALAVDGRTVLELESAGRRERRLSLEAHADRWMRASGALRPVEQGGAAWLVRRGRIGDQPGQPVFDDLPPQERRRVFARLGQMFEHGLPVTPPARLACSGTASAEVDGLAELSPLAERIPLPPRARRRAAYELGRLLGTLRDRGFDPGRLGPGDVLAHPSGALRLAPGYDPTPARGGEFGRVRASCEAVYPGRPSRRERALWVAGIRGALRGPRAEREGWTRELRGR